MSLDHAPKFFWAALSVSMLLLTGGILFIAYRATSISVEFADAKIKFANDKLEVSRIAADTKESVERLRKQRQEWQAVSVDLERRIKPFTSLTATNFAAARPELLEISRAFSNVTKSLPDEKKIEEHLKHLDQIQQSLINPARQHSAANP